MVLLKDETQRYKEKEQHRDTETQRVALIKPCNNSLLERGTALAVGRVIFAMTGFIKFTIAEVYLLLADY